MKPRIAPQPQEDGRQLAEARRDARLFEAWLQTPQGQHWLDSQLESDEERNCKSHWEGW